MNENEHINATNQKVLIIIISDTYNSAFDENLRSWQKLFPNAEKEYAAVLSSNDESVFEQMNAVLPLPLKYRISISNKQIHKLWGIINTHKQFTDDYDWFVKIRPEICVLDEIPLETCVPGHLNGRARVYRGPKSVQYGMSVMGPGYWECINYDYSYNPNEVEIIMDDQIFIFDKPVISTDVFSETNIADTNYPELEMTNILNRYNVKLSVIGLNVMFNDTVKHRFAYSGSFGL